MLVQRTGGPALNRAIRAGLGLATAGMLIPVYWMASGMHPRTVTDANGTEVPMYQGHGIGDPDGHGMPLTDWSLTGGDCRVPHFFALHGIQVLLVLAAVLLVTAVATVRTVVTARRGAAAEGREPVPVGAFR